MFVVGQRSHLRPSQIVVRVADVGRMRHPEGQVFDASRQGCSLRSETPAKPASKRLCLLLIDRPQLFKQRARRPSPTIEKPRAGKGPGEGKCVVRQDRKPRRELTRNAPHSAEQVHDRA
jgi:hypothetical protein